MSNGKKKNTIHEKALALSNKPFAGKAFAIGGGVIITLALLFTMHLLIAIGDPELDESESIVIPKFVSIPENEDPNVIKLPEKPPEPLEKPDTPAPKIQPQTKLTNINANLSAGVSIDANLGTKLNLSDAEYLPIVKIQPLYPSRASERCLDGWTVVKFDVTTSGSVENPVVISSSSQLFESASKRAAKKFKYKPRMSEGKPVRVPGVTNKFTFKMDKSAC